MANVPELLWLGILVICMKVKGSRRRKFKSVPWDCGKTRKLERTAYIFGHQTGPRE